jgi:hypothetical protein
MRQAPSAVSLAIGLDRKRFFLFTPLLQRGVRVKVRVGCSLKSLLEDQVGLNPDYMKDRIKTVFLDGKPVDDWDKALVKDGAVLALSAAMPGLAGATLRRGGVWAGMRSQITHQEKRSSISPDEGFVVMKLFNLLIPELGPFLLEHGVFLPREDWEEFQKGLPDEFWRGCREIRVDGEEKDEGQFRSLPGLSQPGGVWLSVHFSL